MSTYVDVVISPETTTRPVLTSVSQATRPRGSSAITASSTPSEIWSAILSGWPSVTDSDVNRYSLSERGFVVIRSGGAIGNAGRLAGGCWGASTIGAPRVVDDQRHAGEPVALAQAVLEEEPVVARHAAAVRDVHREARRAGVVLRHVQELEPAPADGGRLARGLEVRQEAVQLRGRDPTAGAIGQVERAPHPPDRATARSGRDGHD